MSQSPFNADAAKRQRIESLEAAIGSAVRGEVDRCLAAHRHLVADNAGSVLLAAEARALVAGFGLAGIEDLMLLARGSAEKIAQPSISQFTVGAIGLERETGDLVFGGNVEFPGTHLGLTLHGEGFVFARAFSRGTAIETLALGEAHPCGHCRQFLSEFAATRDLVLIDPLGHRLRMADLYPWPFDPHYLGESGAVPGTIYSPALSLEASNLPAGVAARLTEAGRRSYAPYSRCPGAVVLTLRDGALIAGSAIESVAYNPTIGPLQAALVDLFAHGYTAGEIVGAALATASGGAVDYAASTADLLGRVTPGTPLRIVPWRS